MVRSEILIYVAELSTVLCVLYLYYRIFLIKEDRYEINRFYLLGSLIAAILLPFIEFSWTFSASEEAFQVMLDSLEIRSNDFSKPANAGIDWLSWGYITGCLFALGRLGFFLWKLRLFIKNGKVLKQTSDYTIIQTEGKIQTSSFFTFLFWDETLSLTQSQEKQILAHELSHIKGKHSWDLMFLEIMKIVFWFHPLIYFISRDLIQTHEYIADQETVAQGNSDSYLELLLSQMFGQQMAYTHSFFHSPLKKRIMMLNKKNRENNSIWKYFLIAPLLLGLSIMVGCSQDGVDNQKIIELADQEHKDFYLDNGVEVDKDPVMLNWNKVQREIGYPKLMRDEDIQGRVLIRLLVSASGEYIKHEILESPHQTATDAVNKHVHKALFEPAMKDGKPVEVWVTIPLNFKFLN